MRLKPVYRIGVFVPPQHLRALQDGIYRLLRIHGGDSLAMRAYTAQPSACAPGR